MKDKYEEFKEWLNNLNTEDGVQIRVVEKREWWSVTELFFQYEAEQILQEQEKERKRQFKKIINENVEWEMGCFTINTEKMYEELKEKGLIK